MTIVFAITSLGFAGSLALALWQLIGEVQTSHSLRLELRGVIEHARDLESKHKREYERNLGYQAVVRRLKESIDTKNNLLKKHGVGARDVLDGMLSEGSET